MKFGYGFLLGSKPPESEKSYEQIYSESLELAMVAEQSGFDSIWVAEHHFYEDGSLPAPLTLCAGIAAATEEIQIGTGVLVAPLYPPLHVAEQAAIVDLISGGRFTLGVANGYVEQEFDAFDIPLNERAPRTIDLINICRKAWTGERFSYDGHIFSVDDIVVRPTPSQKNGPNIILGGTSEPAVKRSARMADGHIGLVNFPDSLSDLHTRKQFVDNVNMLANEETSNDFQIVLHQHTYVGENDEEAWEQFGSPSLYYRQEYLKNASDRDTSELTDEVEQKLREADIVGDPANVIDRLKRYEEELPFELHFIARMWVPEVSFEEHKASIQRFGNEVIPEF